MKKQELIIEKVYDSRINKDIVFQFETILYLMGKPDLIGLLVSILFLAQIGFTEFKTQKSVARYLGFSEPTYIKKRKELERLGLISYELKGNRMILNLNYLSRLKLFKLPTTPTEHLKYLDSTAKSLTFSEEKQGQMSLTPSIYNNISPNNTNNEDSNISTTRYPKEDYNIVLDGFTKYKGVKLFGPEIKQHLRAIKTMFRSNRKPKEILDFMKWLHDHESDEQYKWVPTWTIWTVQKKINEFLAGKLETKTGEEELERI